MDSHNNNSNNDNGNIDIWHNVHNSELHIHNNIIVVGDGSKW